MLNKTSFIFLFCSIFFVNPLWAFAAPLSNPSYSIGLFEPGSVGGEVVPPKSLRSSEAAKKIIHSIVSSVGLKPNFEIREGKISNAAAINYKGKRFILYDAKFIERIQNAAQTDWAAVSILAHEIGHHLNGHTMLGKSMDNPALELEADEFSGFILRQLGASLEDAQKAMNYLSSEKQSDSHPARRARLAAIEKGYLAANDRILAYADQPKVNITSSLTSEEDYPENYNMEQSLSSSAEENLFKEVHFSMLPDQTFYLTRQLKLVAMTEKGPAVFGELSKAGERLVLTLYHKKKGSKSFYVAGKGKLVDESNRVVGYIKNRA